MKEGPEANLKSYLLSKLHSSIFYTSSQSISVRILEKKWWNSTRMGIGCFRQGGRNSDVSWDCFYSTLSQGCELFSDLIFNGLEICVIEVTVQAAALWKFHPYWIEILNTVTVIQWFVSKWSWSVKLGFHGPKRCRVSNKI